MQSHIVFTFMAPDKPGLLEQMTTLVADHGASWLESRLATLGGQFTGIVHLEVAEKHSATLRNALLALQDNDFTITVQADADGPDAPNEAHRLLDVLGNDRPGILAEVSRAFSRHGINVEELSSELRSAPMSGDELFAAEVMIAMPASLDQQQFAEELEQIAEELDLDVQLK